jgi:hypothetical protein
MILRGFGLCQQIPAIWVVFVSEGVAIENGRRFLRLATL